MWLQSRMEIVHDLIVVNGRVRHIFSTPQKPLTKKTEIEIKATKQNHDRVEHVRRVKPY